MSIQFDNKEELTENFTYFSISPIVGKFTTIYYELKCSRGTKIIGELEENDYFQLLDAEGNPTNMITLYSPDESEEGDTENALEQGNFRIKTLKFPSLKNDRTFGETVSFNIKKQKDNESEPEEISSYGLHLRSLSSDNVFIDSLASNIIFNPIVLTRVCALDEQEGITSVFEELKRSEDNSQYSFFNSNSQEVITSNFLWKKIDTDRDSNVITSYGVILPPREYNTVLKGESNSPWKRFLLLEGYSLSRYFMVKINVPSGKSVKDYFSGVELILPNDSSNDGYYTKSFNLDSVSGLEEIVDILEKSNPSFLSSSEEHEYKDFAKNRVISGDIKPGFSEETNDKLQPLKFYLKLNPNNATHNHSNFEFDVLNNISIEIVPINEEEDSSGSKIYSDVEGNLLRINFSQIKLPLVIKEFDFSENNSSYGVHSIMNFKSEEDPSLTILETTNKIQKEQFKIPFKFFYSEENTSNNETRLDSISLDDKNLITFVIDYIEEEEINIQ